MSTHIRNFINVTHSLSEKHELFQSLLRETWNTSQFNYTKNLSNFNPDIYCAPLKQALSKFASSVQECQSATVKGTKYEKGYVVVLQQENYQYKIQFAKITIILTDADSKVYLIVEKLRSIFHSHMRIYEIHGTQTFECLNIESLCSHQVLHVYNVGYMRCIRLSYSICGF